MEMKTIVERKFKNGHEYVCYDGADDWTEVEYQSPEWFNSPPMTPEESFEWNKRYAVEANTLEEFSDTFHNRKCGYFDVKGYRESSIEGNREWLEKIGYAMIPPYSSVTGRTCTWYGPGSAESYSFKKRG